MNNYKEWVAPDKFISQNKNLSDLNACDSAYTHLSLCVFVYDKDAYREEPQTSHLKHCDGAIGETDVHSHSMTLSLNKQSMADSSPPAGFLEALGPESMLTRHTEWLNEARAKLMKMI